MTLSLQYSHITVTDPEASLAFYRDALGLDVLNDVASGGHHWITLGAAGGGTQIVLSDPYAGRSQSDGDTIQELVTKGVLTNVVFNTEDDLDEVFERANASEMGLSAYVFTRDAGRAREAAARLEAGMVGVNSFALAAAEAPFGGIKASGMGREGGTEGILDYSNVKLAQMTV